MLENVCLIVSYLQCSFCNSFRQCIARFYFIVMSTVPTTKWEANLHGAIFWIHGCGGHSKVLQNTGLRIWMLELLYDKYCAPFDIPRVTLFHTCVWLKHYPHDALLPRYPPLHLPKIGVFAAKRHVRRGLQHLSLVMTEPSMQHLQHKNNSVPHFPFSLGSWVTFPVVVMAGRSRFQPKYKKSVWCKTMGCTSCGQFVW